MTSALQSDQYRQDAKLSYEFMGLVGQVAAAIVGVTPDDTEQKAWCTRFARNFVSHNPHAGQVPPESYALKCAHGEAWIAKEYNKEPNLTITERVNALRKRRAAAGLCARCGGNREDQTKKMCGTCRAKERKRRRRNGANTDRDTG